MRRWVATVGGRVPVFAGVGTLNTRDTIRRGRALVAAGADGLFVARPMWLALDQQQIVRFYADVAEALPGVPLIVYDNPVAFKGKIGEDAYVALGEIREVVASKHVGGPALVSDALALGDKCRILPLVSDWLRAAELHADLMTAAWTGHVACAPAPLVALARAIKARNWAAARPISEKMHMGRIRHVCRWRTGRLHELQHPDRSSALQGGRTDRSRSAAAAVHRPARKIRAGRSGNRAALGDSAGRVHARRRRRLTSGMPVAATSPRAAPAARDTLVLANRILARHGVVDAFGHVSVRSDTDPTRFWLARSMAPARVTALDIGEYDFAGDAVNGGGGKPYLERFIHAEIYRARPDVGAVVHSHSPAVIPFGVTPTPLRPLYHMTAFLRGPVPVFDIRDAAGDSDMLIRDAALGRDLAAALGRGCAVLQRGHGSTVTGATVPQAVYRAIYLEMNARLQSAAAALGPITFLSDGEAQRAADAIDTQCGRAWELWADAARDELQGETND